MYQVFLITDGCNILVALTVYRFKSSSITMNHVYLSGAASSFCFVLFVASEKDPGGTLCIRVVNTYLNPSFATCQACIT